MKYAMLIEDSETLGTTLQLVLELQGIHSKIYKDYDAALHILNGVRPTFAILSWCHYDAKCHSIAKRLQELGVPYILMSSVPGGDQIAAQYDASFHLKKPFSLEDLSEALHFTLESTIKRVDVG